MGSNEPKMLMTLLESLESVEIDAKDNGAVELAKRYATVMDNSVGLVDEAKVLNDLGPKYQAILVALGMVPVGKTEKSKGEVVDNPDDQLAALRAKRADVRKHGAPSLHSTPS